MIRKKLRKKVKQARDKLPENVVDKAAATLNPLADNQPVPLSDENVPRITSETITEHREEVLKGARKYIYPLAHSKRRIVIITTTIVVGAIVALLIYCVLGMYRYYQYNAFLYRVSQVVPFPIARFGGTFIDYENYLFELRRYVHYYETQQQDLFGGDKQIKENRKQVLDGVINNAYIKKLASQNDVEVSGKEVDSRVAIVREQNRLGSNDKVFADVLRDYWGWSIADFKRALKEEILAEKVAAKLDMEATAKAQDTLSKLRGGADFAQLAKTVSEDERTKANGGDYGFSITKTDPNVPPQVVDALFKLKAGETSDIIVASPVNIGQPVTLQIVKVTETDGTNVKAQHISFNLKDISTYVKSLKDSQPARVYVRF